MTAAAVDLAVGSPEWTRRITASKVAAVLGLSPWQSPYSLWRLMRGEIPADPGNAYTSRGTLLEPAVLQWWTEEKAPAVVGDWTAWTCDPQSTYTLGEWAAATPDMAICPLAPEEPGKVGRKILPPRVLVEAKTTAQEWGGDLPAYYLVQVLWQLHVSGADVCHVAVLGPRLVFEEYVIRADDYREDMALIEGRARAFYDSLADDVPPPLDDTVATYDAVRRLHPEIERGESVEVPADVARALVEWTAVEKDSKTRARLARSQVLEAAGRAQYVTAAGVRVARRQPRGDDVSLVVVAKPDDLAHLTDPTTEGDQPA